METPKEVFEKLISEGLTSKEMMKRLGISHSTLFRVLKKFNLSIPNIHNSVKFNNHVFDTIDNESKAYWLGFLFGDGYVGYNVNAVELSIKGSDIEHLFKFATFLEYDHSIVRTGIAKCQNKEYSRCRILLREEHFHNRLVEVGCTYRKSLTLKFPQSIMNQELERHFMRGYFDADGCITLTSSFSPRLLINGTKEFLEDFNIRLNGCGKIKKTGKRNVNTFVLDISQNPARACLDFLYKDATIFLDRKYKRYELAVLHSDM